MTTRYLLPAILLAVVVPASAHAQATLHVEPTDDRGAVRRDLYGFHVEPLTEDVPDIDPLLSGAPIVRFPGGDADQVYLWTDTDPGPCDVPRLRWPALAERASRLGIGFYLETNLVRGTPEDAVRWLDDALSRGLRVSWVGVGNEVWGPWDAGYRSPETYAADVAAYASALRGAHPEVRIVLSIGTFNEEAWNREAIRRSAADIDAVDYHYYPNKEEEADPLEVAAGADGIGPLVERIRAMIAEEAPADADRIAILIGEWDGAADPPRWPTPPEPGRAYALWSMADALFYASAIGEMQQHGVEAAFFYELQGYRFGSVRGSSPSACIDADYTTVRPKAHAVRLWRERFGDRMVGARAEAIPTFVSAGPTNWDGFAGEAPYLRAYASVEDDDGSLRLALVNRHPDQAISLALELGSFSAGPTAHVWELAGDSILATNENVGGAADAVRVTERDVALEAGSPTFEVPAHAFVVLAIPPAAVGPRDGGPPEDTDAGGASDGSGPSPDASARDAAAPPAAGGDDDGGCGCVAAGSEPGRSRWTALSLGLLAAPMLIRRRTRRRR